MLDSNNLVELIKKAANDTNEASEPCDFCYGKVTNVNPLKVFIEQKMELGKAQLVLSRNVTDYETKVTVEWESETSLSDHDHIINGTDSNGDSIMITSQKTNLSHSHAIEGMKKIIIHNGLKVGDEVVLIKKKGGQKYLILDRVVTV